MSPVLRHRDLSQESPAMRTTTPHEPWYLVFDRVYDRFQATVRRRAAQLIGKRLRRRVDDEDVAQSVFRTFHRRTTNGECAFDNTRALCGYLLEITSSKVNDLVKAHNAKMRDVWREVELPSSLDVRVPTASYAPPGELAALRDEFDYVTRDFSPRDLEILRLCLQGYATPEIALQTDCSRWTVRRVLNAFRTNWLNRHGSLGEA